MHPGLLHHPQRSFELIRPTVEPPKGGLFPGWYVTVAGNHRTDDQNEPCGHDDSEQPTDAHPIAQCNNRSTLVGPRRGGSHSSSSKKASEN